MGNILQIENVTFSYGKRVILKDLSFKCENGIIGLLGNNGVGKTTLMNILTGLKKGSKGKALLNDVDLLNTKAYPIQHVGYLPQHFDIYYNITGYDFLSYVYDVKNFAKADKKKIIDETIERFHLQSVIHQRVGRYSGGYKRRLGIAQAVLGKPALIIIDEPTVGLDPEQRVEFRSFLSEISKESITLISTHIIEDIELYSDHILILKDKSLQFEGSIDEIIQASSPYIYTIETNLATLATLKKQVIVLEERRLNKDLVKVRFIKNHHEIIGSYHEKEISLENAYVYFQKR
ncbi:ATP-binding cassette domain-containing protein [Viridibacillus sp. NPDC096237]|uniref:ATP-binding cassette domain-containing protein n=1 Tax=Viridibacillus sp. NPDC096237 TaxID=3390721 RepID=UPI003D034DA4